MRLNHANLALLNVDEAVLRLDRALRAWRAELDFVLPRPLLEEKERALGRALDRPFSPPELALAVADVVAAE